MGRVRRAVKSLRAWPPVNRPITRFARYVLRAAHVDPTLAMRHLQRVGEVREVLPNGRVLRLISRGDDWIANEVFWRGALGYEPETSRTFFELARTARTVIDVGSFVGYYAILAALANPSARVLAFEPHPLVATRLRQNAELNVLSQIECFEAAVGEQTGEAELFHPTVDVPSSSSLSPEFMDSWLPRAAMKRTRVPVVALDQFCTAHDVRSLDMIKIDTETTEPQVLHGMRETLTRERPAIICEVLAGWDTDVALSAILDPLNYEYFVLTPTGPSRRPSLRADPMHPNQLFRPAPSD